MTTSAPNSGSPLFSVVICTYRRYLKLHQAIETVLKQTLEPESYDIWIMDNTPPCDERTQSHLKYRDVPRLNYIEIDTPGLSHARNEAIRLSRGQYIVFLDDDALAVPEWLSSYQAAFEKAPHDVAAIGGRIVAAFESPRPEWLHDSMVRLLSVYDEDVAASDYQPCGANVAFRRDIFEHGVFRTALGRQGDETNNMMSGEESFLTNKIRLMGGKFGYEPRAIVRHQIPAERLTRSWFRKRAAWQAISDQLQQSLKKEDALTLWSFVVQYLKNVPREHMPFMGLFWDTHDPELFRMQLVCTQFLTHIMISQGCYPPEMLGNSS